MTIQFTNNASTTLASGITAIATSLTVATGAGALFPTPSGAAFFYCTLQNVAGTLREIVKVTARTTDTFTIVRGQDGTTGQIFSTSDKVELRVTAADLNNFGQLDTGNTWSLAQTFPSGQALVAPALGTPSSGTLTSCTGLPISTGISGLGTSVASALAIAVGTAGSFVTNGGALGTPSSGTLTNCTFPTLNQNTTGSSGSTTGNAATATTATNLSGGTVAATTITATGNITAYYSDDRLKTNFGNIPNALFKVNTLNGFYYEANETAQALGYKPVREVGVSAQQVQAILPEIIAPAPIDNKYLTVHYERLVPLLIEAIKELTAKVEALEAK